MALNYNKSRVRRVMQAGAILVAVGVGYGLHEYRVDAQGDTGTTPPAQKTPVVATQATRDAAATQNAFVEVASAVQPAVVTIMTGSPRPQRASTNKPAPRFRPFGNSAPNNGGGANGGDMPNDFQEFFKKFQRDFGFQGQSYNPNSWQGRVLREQAMAKYRQIQDDGGDEKGGGLGSGMIYREDGLILTNAHVVANASTVAVTLSDGRKFDKAKVLGRDLRTDIAVVKIDATNLPTVKLGDSNDVRVGDWAIAVGNPFGLDHTLTVGVISAKSRELNLAQNQDTRTDYLQTDASINPGNSGGPLLDIYGRVIGVNNAIYSESGGNQGIGFAIPVSTARYVADQIAKEGRVRRGYLGVQISNVEDTGAAFGLPAGTKGVLVQAISDPKGPGAMAGLLPGDVVTAFNGQNVTHSSELQRLVGNSPVGSKIELTVLRDGKTVNLSATLQELKDDTDKGTGPAAPSAQPKPGPAAGAASSVIPGLHARDLSAEVARALGIDITKGVVVTQVTPDSDADDAGLLRGDVILSVATTPVTTVAGMESAAKQVLGRQTGDSKQVALYISRGGQKQFVIVTID